jgi:hypothetical protein
MSGMQPRPTLERIPAGTHTADDLEFLLTADSEQPLVERIPLLRIHHNLNLGKMLLFRVHPGPGTILCEIIPANGVKRLEIVRGAEVMYQHPIGLLKEHGDGDVSGSQ